VDKFPRYLESFGATLFCTVGEPSDVLLPRCDSWQTAREVLRSDHTEYALLESANKLHSFVQSEMPSAWAAWPAPAKIQLAMCKQLVIDACDRLSVHGVSEDDDEIISLRLGNILMCSWCEHHWDVPSASRLFTPMADLISEGRVVCGWVNGVFPSGSWAIW